MSLAELLIDFVPRDAYLIYALISREWLRMWKLRRFPARSNVIHFVETMDLINIVTCDPNMLVNVAMRKGDVEIISALYGSMPHEFRIWHYNTAAMYGHLDVLKWSQNSSQWPKTIVTHAAGSGNLEAVKWLRLNGCSYYENTCATAAREGRLEVLQWLHENGCPWDSWTCAGAAEAGHLDILIWARENGCPWDKNNCLIKATSGGYRHAAQWIKEN